MEVEVSKSKEIDPDRFASGSFQQTSMNNGNNQSVGEYQQGSSRTKNQRLLSHKISKCEFKDFSVLL